MREGWDVISADAVRVGRVVEEDREGFVVVELLPTLGQAADAPLPAEPPASPLTDPNPTVAETEIYAHQNAGALQHAVDTDEEAPRRVRISARLVQEREEENQVVVGSLRSQEIAALPAVGSK